MVNVASAASAPIAATAATARVVAATGNRGKLAEIGASLGDNGFGYDPVFFIEALGKTAAQLEAAVKNRLSHRGQALRRLKAALPQLL